VSRGVRWNLPASKSERWGRNRSIQERKPERPNASAAFFFEGMYACSPTDDSKVSGVVVMWPVQFDVQQYARAGQAGRLGNIRRWRSANCFRAVHLNTIDRAIESMSVDSEADPV
jgi:hypothetical protein